VTGRAEGEAPGPAWPAAALGPAGAAQGAASGAAEGDAPAGALDAARGEARGAAPGGALDPERGDARGAAPGGALDAPAGVARGWQRPMAWPGPVGRPARPHWWSAQPAPPAGPLTAARAYAEILIVFGAFFAAGIVAGGETLAGRYPAQRGSWAVFGPEAVQEIAICVLAVLVVVLLSARRGITPRMLGIGWPRRADGRPGAAQSLRIAAWAVAALGVGGTVTAELAGRHHLVQPVHQDYGYFIFTMAASLAAGVVEELVVLAFVVTTLRQARRPLAEILVVAILLRCSYHDYYGLGVAGIAIWAAVFIWLFLRTGSVLPMLVVHVLWDMSIYAGERWDVALVLRAYTIGLLYLAAAVTWLAGMLGGRGRGGVLPPGPDPGPVQPP